MTVPSLRSATECDPPAATSTYVRPGGRAGTLHWPSVLRPQATTPGPDCASAGVAAVTNTRAKHAATRRGERSMLTPELVVSQDDVGGCGAGTEPLGRGFSRRKHHLHRAGEVERGQPTAWVAVPELEVPGGSGEDLVGADAVGRLGQIQWIGDEARRTRPLSGADPLERAADAYEAVAVRELRLIGAVEEDAGLPGGRSVTVKVRSLVEWLGQPCKSNEAPVALTELGAAGAQ